MHWLNQHLIQGWTKGDVLSAMVALGTLLLAGFTARVASRTTTLGTETKDLAEATKDAMAAEDRRFNRQIDIARSEDLARRDREWAQLVMAAADELALNLAILGDLRGGGYAWTLLSNRFLPNVLTGDVTFSEVDNKRFLACVAAVERYNTNAAMANANLGAMGRGLSDNVVMGIVREVQQAIEAAVPALYTYRSWKHKADDLPGITPDTS